MASIDRSREADAEQITDRCRRTWEGLTDLSTRVLALGRQGLCGEASRSVHLVSGPRDTEESGVMGALCGMSLVADQAETVAPRAGMPTLPLPPSITPLGPIVWRRAPATPELAECREIDLFSAVRTGLPAAAHTQGGRS